MGRIPQEKGVRGSQKWLQVAVDEKPDILKPESQRTPIRWLSPLREDAYAEYSGSAFLDRLGLERVKEAMAAFWPERGAVWDGLGIANERVFLVEAKSHIREFFSGHCGASSAESRKRIRNALDETSRACHASGGADWMEFFYQYTNRMAHLYFLRREGVDARLVNVCFLNDTEMGGPREPAEWKAAFDTARYVLGLPVRHALSRYIDYVYPDIDLLQK
ncbi:hypothetical protein [Aquisalinus flavus]|uniref:Uncharacterized protein n=1 Tax=Aquisalinus flavus TaxID=1526572 RepID=A0A8J2V1P8_9PROT|nr:hypothetical protein [Aquisalinus flavus]MBD0426145.1 hypothetical protein [Aquisalinus flavus]UNE48274.1 hypothetical protein FF099_09550 [Aquisalinus flavus]GGD10265.1 hypothetical protein GCM10011342_18940 [Aquisalinus flavus]